MAYIPLSLGPQDSQIAALISMATEQHLEQAHYLLAATYSSQSPNDHFGHSSLILTLLAVASASAIRCFDLSKNKNSVRDRTAFIDCVRTYFPWEHVSIVDDQYRDEASKRAAASEQLYDLFRNPLVHCGGIVAKGFRRGESSHVIPGRATFQENEADIVEICNLVSYEGQVLMRMRFDATRVYTRPLYWCARKMIEAFAADPAVQADIKKFHRC